MWAGDGIFADMKRMIFAIAALLLCVYGSAGQGFTSLSTRDFLSMTRDGGYVILDVRTADEFAEGHLDGALNIDVRKDDFSKIVSKSVRNGSRLAVYCRSGRRSKEAVKILSDMGFSGLELDKGYLSVIDQAGKFPESRVLIHSHNDYAQQAPFWLAYALKATTVECDMFYVGGSKFLIGHGKDDFLYNQDFDKFYLEPIVRMVRYNGGHIWNDDANREIQLLIDLKSDDAAAFMTALVQKLNKYPDVFDRSVNPHACLVVISGNMPAPEDFDKYPSFIAFDGTLDREYTPAQLERVALFSEYTGNYSRWDGKSEMSAEDENRLKAAVSKAHSLGKRIRFWEFPDTPAGWDKSLELGFDYINTDKLVQCTVYLKKSGEL